MLFLDGEYKDFSVIQDGELFNVCGIYFGFRGREHRIVIAKFYNEDMANNYCNALMREYTDNLT